MQAEDKRLLELAAKADGHRLTWKTGYCKGGEFRGAFIDGRDDAWNPLTDDGDALRLAVKLNLIVECMVGQTAARTFNNIHAGCVDHADTKKYPKRDFNPDCYAATRRVIVRTAAAIGEAMP